MPVTPVVVAAVLGGLAVVWIFDVSLVGALLAGQRPDAGLVSGWALGLLVACYLPIFLWGPLELLATYGYWQHRRAERPPHEARLAEDRSNGVDASARRR
ncbi:MAG: hypothetical protein KDB26_13095 [Microthrixaceae bacterium]|nr:hypothetical protein [Microthrixaceae bacterium]